jgi:hypothetical protein
LRTYFFDSNIYLAVPMQSNIIQKLFLLREKILKFYY